MNAQYVTIVKEIVVAVVSNPNFFSSNATGDYKIKQVCDLIKAIDKEIEF